MRRVKPALLALICALCLGIANVGHSAPANDSGSFSCPALEGGKHLGREIARDLQRLDEISSIARRGQLNSGLRDEADRLALKFTAVIGRATQLRADLPMLVTLVDDIDRILVKFGEHTLWAREPTLWRARLKANILHAYWAVGCVTAGLRVADDALKLAASDPSVSANVRVNQAALLIRAGRLPEAIKNLEETVPIYGGDTTYGGAKGLLGTYNALGVAWRRSGALLTAAQYYRLASSLLEQEWVVRVFADAAESGLADRDEREKILATLLVNEGVQLSDADQGRAVITIYARALALRRKVLDADDPEIALVLRNLARQLTYAGAIPAARTHLDEAIAILRGHPNLAREHAIALAQSGEIALGEGDLRRALEDLDTADEKSRAFANAFPVDRANILTLKSRVMRSARRLGEAEQATIEALRIRRATLSNLHPNVAGELLTLSGIQKERGQPLKALTSIREARSIVNGWIDQEAADCRAGVPPKRSMTSGITEAYLDLLFDLQENGAAENTDDEFFALIQSPAVDRTGAAVLRSALRQRAPDTESVRLYQALTQQICAHERTLTAEFEAPRGAATAATLAESIERLRQERNTAAAKISLADLALVRSGRLAVPLGKMQQLLNDREALIAFRVGAGSSAIAILVSRDGKLDKRFIRAPNASFEAVSGAIRDLRAAVGAAKTKEDLLTATEKIKSILAPFDPSRLLDGAVHVFVVGDGPLEYWPAHFLPAGDGLLGDARPISSLPSITALGALRERAAPSPASGLIGIGAPLLHPLDCARAEALGLASLPKGTANRDILCLGQIPGAQPMLSRLGARFAPSKILAGREATRAAASQLDFSSAGTVIFATHGLVGDGREVPGLHEPALVLTPNASTGEDGLLRAQDILRLRMDNVSLAMIAACNSGAADPSTYEEGFSGLGLAFIFAGARALVVSHWYVDIEATMILAESMLARLAQADGTTIAQALDEAMRSLAAKPRFASPAFWGGFVVIGDGWAAKPRK
jgi:CHAT domain-containing protein